MTRGKTKNTTGRDAARSAVAAGDRLIGAFVYWTELRDLKVSRALFRQGVDGCGLSDALAAPPSAEKIINSAVRGANARVSGDVETKTKTGYAELKEKTTHAVYAVLARRDVGGVRTYVEEATVAIDRGQPAPIPVVATRASVPVDVARDALIAAIVEEYQELLSYSYTQEVSETLVKAVRDVCDGLTLKSGFYLVREEHLPAMQKLQAFLCDTCGVQLETWEIRETVANRQAAQRNATSSLRETYAELLADVQTFTAKHAGEPEDVPMRSVACKLREFKQLDGKVALYADVLGDYAASLRTAIADARRSMLTSLGLDDADEAAAA